MEKLIHCKYLYDQLKNRINFLKGQRNTLSSQLKDKKDEYQELNSKVSLDSQCVEIFKNLGETVQKRVIKDIEEFVSRIYQYVFQTSDSFRIKYEIKRSVPNMEFVVVNKQGIEFDPIDSLGGGTVDVLSFALRLIGLLLIRPKMRQVLILDEPFKHLSVFYRPRMMEILNLLCKERGVQIIMTTHQQEFMNTDSVFVVSNEQGVSRCLKNI